MAWIVVVVIVFLWISACLNILREHERAAVFRLGRLLPVLKGRRLIFILWPIDKIVRISLRGDAVGVAQTDLAPAGKVLFHGESWDAHAEPNILSGARIKICEIDGLTLQVEPAPEAR